jgi:hypothetical protein
VLIRLANVLGALTLKNIWTFAWCFLVCLTPSLLHHRMLCWFLGCPLDGAVKSGELRFGCITCCRLNLFGFYCDYFCLQSDNQTAVEFRQFLRHDIHVFFFGVVSECNASRAPWIV